MSDYFDRVERQIVRRVEEGTRRPSLGAYLPMVAAVLVVIVVAGVFLLARSGRGRAPAPASHSGLMSRSRLPRPTHGRLTSRSGCRTGGCTPCCPAPE